MPKGQIKKLYIMQILEILRKYTDYDHKLKQNEIANYLQNEYGTNPERKAIARNIDNLKDMGYEIEYENGYYLAERTFEDSELRLMIDSILASRIIPSNQAKELITKLVDQSNIYFKQQEKYANNIDKMSHDKFNLLFLSIEVLSEAIAKKQKVEFFYNKYGPDKKLYHTSEEKHLINPYQIVAANGKYYLIGNVDKYDNVTHFRIEKISEIEIIDIPVKKEKNITELKAGLDLPKHMIEHVYMYSGKSSYVKFKTTEKGINEAIDWFGSDIEITKAKPDNITDLQAQQDYVVRVKVNENAMKYWAVQFGEQIEVIEPKELRLEIKKTLANISKKYI